MGRCSSLPEGFERVKTLMGLERFEVDKFCHPNSQSLGIYMESDFWPKKTLQFFSGPGVYLIQKLIWYNWRPTRILSFELFQYLGSKPLWVYNYLKLIFWHFFSTDQKVSSNWLEISYKVLSRTSAEKIWNTYLCPPEKNYFTFLGRTSAGKNTLLTHVQQGRIIFVCRTKAG